jgi:hypothetical protein
MGRTDTTIRVISVSLDRDVDVLTNPTRWP